jgi:hypothetical protein
LLLQENTVIRIQRQVLRVGVVRIGDFDFSDKILIEEYLTNVRSVGANEGSIRKNPILVSLLSPQKRLWAYHLLAVGMGHDVDVGSTTIVVAGEQSGKLSNTIILGRLKATKESAVDVVSGIDVTVATSVNATVDPGRVRIFSGISKLST